VTEVGSGAVRQHVAEISSQPEMLLKFTRARRPLATQQGYRDMKSAAVAGCGGWLALNPSPTALAQNGTELEWGGGGDEVVW
jgi:hypothetical protein